MKLTLGFKTTFDNNFLEGASTAPSTKFFDGSLGRVTTSDRLLSSTGMRLARVAVFYAPAQRCWEDARYVQLMSGFS